MRWAFLLALAMGFANAALAQDATGLGGLPQGKSATATASRTKSMSVPDAYGFGPRSAPVSLGTSESNPDVVHQEAPKSASRGCTSDFCYDAGDNHIVYRPARLLMPKFAGLTAENISINRHGVRLKYSFP